ncbi:DUF3667 domain-containing protein [Nubsella zeaxanthinifaciens]|jgi:hypothetical protein|uniref:DUF3667 domain-containing protein n=1 Tax=Nubsella zeaxanthinifaciens TaxID=392412 RepID=UPI000DE30B3A|nr:DUF3667 domain-containing protein [Nubsella zeaxanthinifaciens]
MEQTCLNCDYTIDENYCRHCGQKRFKRIDKKYVTDEIQYLLIHTNKGFLYTVKKLIKSPGGTAKEFIDGNRVNHYKPMLLAFLLSGISAFISFKIIGFAKIMRELYEGQHMNSAFMNDYMSFVTSYNSFIMLAMIPVFALSTWIAFHNWKNNYYEHIVMNAYILAAYNIMTIVIVYPILFAVRHNTNLVSSISTLSFILTPFLLTWFFKGFYIHKPLKQIIWKVLASLGLVSVAFFILMVVVAIAAFIYGITQGPEAIKYLQPVGK